MKLTNKTWLIGLCLIIAGAVIFGIALAAGGWDISSLDGVEYRTVTVDIDESFTDIAIDTDTEDIAFVPSEDGKCRVVFVEREKEEHTASVKGNALEIALKDTRKWYDHITLFSVKETKVTVYLPAGGYGRLTVKESTGDISIPGDFGFESADITVSTGDVSLNASVSGRLRVAADTGSIRLEDLSAGEIDLKVTTGGVTARGVICEGNMAVRVSTGRTELTNVTCAGFTSTGSTGRISMENVICADAMEIERSTGNVKLDRCDAAEIGIKTGTGSVTGTLMSEKVFIAKSSTGRVDVPETTTGGACRITTSTGNIIIGIE